MGGRAPDGSGYHFNLFCKETAKKDFRSILHAGLTFLTVILGARYFRFLNAMTVDQENTETYYLEEKRIDCRDTAAGMGRV